MRKGVVTRHIVNTLQAQAQVQEQPPQPLQHHHLHAITPPSSGWKSPIPYLFGGLAAMLGLIAFALLILACSYWKLSGYQDNNAAVEDTRDGASDEKPKDATTTAYFNSILVIMAGDEKPTFLATPATSRASSFGDRESDRASSSGGGDGGDGEEKDEKEVVVVLTGEDKR